MRQILTVTALPAALAILVAGCHAHGPGGHRHGPDGAEVSWSEGPKADPRPKNTPAQDGRSTEWWGLYDGKQNIATRRVTQRPVKTGGHELVVETDWFDGNINNLIRVRGATPFSADDVLVKTFSDGLVKRELTFEREAPGSTVMIVRDRHNEDVRRVAVPGDALTLWQLPRYVESPRFGGEARATVTLLDTEGLIATWTLSRAGTARIRLHGALYEASIVEGRGDAIDGHSHAEFYLVGGRVELMALGDAPTYLLRASRGGARQDLDHLPVGR